MKISLNQITCFYFAIMAVSGIANAQTKPNVVFVLSDQWRAQATGYAGDPNVKTPELDKLAERSLNFATAVAVMPVCTPYRASLLTGRFPTSTGMIANDLYLPGEELTMAEMFKGAGYDTGYIGKWHLDGHGRESYIPVERRQGFEYWKVLECTHNYNNSLYYDNSDPKIRKWEGYDAYAQTEDAQEYLRTQAKKDNPFLLVISYGGPHFPHHIAPEELKAMYPPESIKLPPNVPERMQEVARREAQGYYAHCTAIDSCIDDLLETLDETGLAENTIFIFTSDHGEMLGSHGISPKLKHVPWDESILVPFLLRYPAKGAEEGRIIKASINTPDILPTLLALSGIAIPDTIEGEDLSGLVLDPKRADEDRAALFMNLFPFRGFSEMAYRGIRTPRYTYVRYEDGSRLLYDNQVDPFQMNNLAKLEHQDLIDKMEARLQAKLGENQDEFLSADATRKLWNIPLNVPYNFKRAPDGSTLLPEDFKPISPNLSSVTEQR